MFVFWGQTYKEKELGYVCDFCPVCRGLRAFKLVRTGISGHVYGISFSEGRLACYLIECLNCGQSVDALLSQYTAIEQKRPCGNETLEKTTFPHARLYHADRLALVRILGNQPFTLPPAYRATLLFEQLMYANPMVEHRYANNTDLDKQSGVGCAGTLMMAGILFYTVFAVTQGTDRLLLACSIVATLIVFAYTVVQMALGPKRHLRAKVLPRLARALKPLQPTRAELEAGLEKCRMARMKIGKKLELDDLWAELINQMARTA